MDDIRLTRSLLEHGYNYGDLRRLQRGGELVRVRRGAYARDNEVDQLVEKRHRRLMLRRHLSSETARSSAMDLPP
jgi:hypothetical protein